MDDEPDDSKKNWGSHAWPPRFTLKNRVYEKPLALMLEGVERLFQVFVVEFEVGEFELERVIEGF